MCMIDDVYTESTGFVREYYRTARKPHRCTECAREIAPGERYHYARWLSDGGFGAAKTCAHCAAAADVLVKHCGGYICGNVIDDLQDHFDPTIPWRHAAGRYVVGIRRQWRRFGGEGLMPVPSEVAAQ